MVDAHALHQLNEFRRAIKKPLLCNFGALKLRGLRSPSEQLQLVRQGLTNTELSQHVAGKAFDLTCTSMTASELFEAAKIFGFGGVGLYKSKNFVHVDTRPLWGAPQAIWIYE